MKHKKLFLLFMLAFLLAMIPAFTFADVTDIRAEFNGLNNGNGYIFKPEMIMSGANQYAVTGTPTNVGEIRLRNAGGANQTPNLNAYTNSTSNNGTSTSFYFQTFCIDPEAPFDKSDDAVAGNLDYRPNNGSTRTSNGVALNVGVAFLYKMFASEELADIGYNYSYGSYRGNSAAQLQDAIWYLMGLSAYEDATYYTGFMKTPSTSWTSNVYLYYLNNYDLDYLALGFDSAEDFWVSAYNLNTAYAFMDDAKVFVVQTNSFDTSNPDAFFQQYGMGPGRQDVLYVIRDGGGDTHTPEPASLLLWILGVSGAFGTTVRRRFTNKNA